MSIMSDVTIPEDVMDIARNVASAIHLKLHRAFVPEEGEAIIARALLAEREAMRERCAMIADAEFEAMKRLDMEHYRIHATNSAEICGAKARTAESIAQAIRSSHE